MRKALKAAMMLDFYKTGHGPQYPEGTEIVYSNFTPRSPKHSNIEGNTHVTYFGLQGVVKSILIDLWNDSFFKRPKEEVVNEYKELMDGTMGPGMVGVDHIAELHDLGYLPLKIKSLPEGSEVPYGVPVFTVVNTNPRFFWLTNYLETMLSAELWNMTTAATTAKAYRKEFDRHAELTGADKAFIDWQGHDFSARGHNTMFAAMVTGAGHLTSFTGTDTVPSIVYLDEYYDGGLNMGNLIGGSVPACYDSETEVLTEKGFIKFSELEDGIKVAQYHENGSISFVLPTEYYNMPYSGEMVKWSTKSSLNYIDLLVTPNHRMVRINNKTKKLDLFEAGDTSYRNRSGYSHRNSIPVSGKTDKSDVEFTSLDRLKIAFQADGSFPSRSDVYKSGQIRFSLKKSRKIERLTDILSDLDFKFSVSKKDKRGYVSFWINPNESLFEKSFDWININEISYSWAKSFIEELQFWDGTKRKNHIKYDSINKSCVDKVQSIGILCGYRGQVSSYQDKREDNNRQIIYSISLTNKESITGEGFTRDFVQYNGTVHCVSVPTKMLIVRRNNRSVICGNTEHSVMCMGGKEDELGTFRRLITELYPSGIVSIVSDTWDFWQVITEFTPALKDEILAREGRVVLRPDSGSPEDIICGKGSWIYDTWCPGRNPDGTEMEGITDAERKGAYQYLWEIFGGEKTSKGYDMLHNNIGLIYGDSITPARQKEILRRLESKNFTATNLVLGIGSYTYQFVTRDTHGFAMKATWGQVNGVGREIFKDPKTDSGLKKSAKGLLKVEARNKDYVLVDQVSKVEENGGELKTIFEDGVLVHFQSLSTIRENVKRGGVGSW